MKVDQPAETFRLWTNFKGNSSFAVRIGTGPHPEDFEQSAKSKLGLRDASSAVEQVTHLNDALLAQLDLPKMESFWFTAADNTKLQGFLIRPPGFDPAKKYPVKFLIHGGPQGAWGDAWSYRWNRRAVCRQRLRRRHDQPARLDRLRPGHRRWRQRRLGRQALYRPDDRPRLR